MSRAESEQLLRDACHRHNLTLEHRYSAGQWSVTLEPAPLEPWMGGRQPGPAVTITTREHNTLEGAYGEAAEALAEADMA